MIKEKDLRIVFMGTPEFAVASLDILVQNNYNIAAVVTIPDKPAGRGQQLQQSDIKKYALQHNIKVLQPEKLKDPQFLAELEGLKADLQIVVAFRMLPEVVWKMPRLGTFNLHGSLLPQYRGAAPINRAVMNGEKETGVTTFFLQHQIDTGKILFREKIEVGENETAGEVHDRLKDIGAGLVLKTVRAIESGDYRETDQSAYYKNEAELRHAPKIFREDCRILWNRPVHEIHNLVRGLSPYPAAFTEFADPSGRTFQVKIFRTTFEEGEASQMPGTLLSDNKTYLKVAAPGGYLNISELQVAGKKRMPVNEFLRGFPIEEGWKAL